ncbi:MAG: tRNA (N(6)-L-threonylcarbamoyladenosine(37)-C(2))-methylthiotransferase MtaB [Candidatus Electrothrix sp. YB6]
MNPPKVAVTTLGCKVNQFESAAFLTGFREQDCAVVSAAEEADIVVINTCAVTARAGQQSRQLIRKIARANPDVRLIVTGCYAEASATELAGLIPDRSLTVIGNSGKHQVVQAALSGELPSPVPPAISRAREICPLPVRRFSGRTRAYLRIQDGCNNFCAYCIVPYTRGRSRSLPLKNVLEQVRVFVEEGYPELVITGINVGKYGLDLDEGQGIYSLLETLCREFPNLRIRLSSVEPTEVNDRLLDLIIGYANFMPHLHIPLQSGDNGVLSRMNRKYSTEFFARIIEKIHTALPHAAIGCDILAGFPGEDEQAAENSFRLLDDLPVTYLHVFPYSIRPGTAAAEFPDQVPGPVKEARVAHLRTLDQKKRTAFYQRHLCTEQLVLLERQDKKTGLFKGFSENYIPVQCSGTAGQTGIVVPVRLVRLREKAVFGEQAV